MVVFGLSLGLVGGELRLSGTKRRSPAPGFTRLDLERTQHLHTIAIVHTL